MNSTTLKKGEINLKTMVLYATKYGASKAIAERIAGKIAGAEVYDLKKDAIPAAAGYDCVIVGGSLYAGMVRKEAKEYVANNADILRGKRLGLFVSGINGEGEQEYFKANFPEEILKAAKAAKYLGGAFDPAKAGFFAKFIMRIITKQSGLVDKTADDSKIDAFIKAVMD